MKKGRMEAFSDGVIAIIITIMVLELKVPHGVDLEALVPLIPVFTSYLLSFVFVGIYWNSHHHLIHAADHVNGRTLWANLHFLFWLSMMPFATGWMSESGLSSWSVAIYGVVLLFSGVGYYALTHVLIANHEKGHLLARSTGLDMKGILTALIYLVAIGTAFRSVNIACAMYVGVACWWLIPNTMIEAEVERGAVEA